MFLVHRHLRDQRSGLSHDWRDGWRWSASSETRLFLMVGALGGFTTFSSFSLDTLALIRAGHDAQAVLNVVGQVGLSLFGVSAGYRLAQW